MGRLAVICVLLTLADCLEVTSHPPQGPVLLHRGVLLRCEFSGAEVGALVDIWVIWTVKRGASLQQVYKFDGRSTTVERAGSRLDVSSLPAGNASLYLPHLTLQDAGEYTCAVFVATDAGTATLTLRVTAQPTMWLSPLNPSLMVGESRTFLCDLSGFYPENVEIIWYKRVGDKEAPEAKNICTGLAVPEDGGTFRVSSQIAAEFSQEDGGAALICEAKHESLWQPLRKNSTVRLTDPGEMSGNQAVTAAATVGTISLVGIMAAAFVMLYRRFLTKVPPLVSPLIFPEQNSAGEKMVAVCNINGFRPRTIAIRWYVYKSGEEEEEGERSSGEEPLLTTDLTANAQHSFTKQGGVFSVTSQLSYTPHIQDHGARLVCAVEHKALPGVTRQERPINIVARPRKMYLTSPPLVPRPGDTLTLSCIVERFYPKPITVSWVRNQEQLSDVTLYGPFPCDGHYYSAWSQIELKLSQEDEGTSLTCQVSHISLGSPEELCYEINLEGRPPEVQFISADPPHPGEGEETRLSCMIRNFFPIEMAVLWFRDGVQQARGVTNSVCVQSSRGLYSMCSILRLRPQAEHHGSTYTCQVRHAALRTYQERSYTLYLPTYTTTLTQ